MKDLVENQIMHLDNAEVSEKAAELSRYDLFVRGMVATIMICFGIGVFGAIFDVRNLSRQEQTEQHQTDCATAGMFYAYKAAKGQAQFHKDCKAQWAIQNEAASASLAEQVQTNNELAQIRLLLSARRQD